MSHVLPVFYITCKSVIKAGVLHSFLKSQKNIFQFLKYFSGNTASLRQGIHLRSKLTRELVCQLPTLGNKQVVISSIDTKHLIY